MKIIDLTTHPTLFQTSHIYQYVSNQATFDLLTEDELDACFYSNSTKKYTPTYILPALFFNALEQDTEKNKATFILEKLKEKNLTSLIEAIFVYGLIREQKAEKMQYLLPYVNVNQHLSFDKYADFHYCAGLTPLMISKEQKTVDLLLSLPHLDLSVKAKPMEHWPTLSRFLWDNPHHFERIHKKTDFLKIEGKTAFEYSILYKEKYKRNKFLEKITPEQRLVQEKEKFDLILADPIISSKKTKFLREVFMNNQYLLEHLNDNRLREVLKYKNKKQNNALFHAIKEGRIEMVKKLIDLNYFNPKDKSTNYESYFDYAYNYGSKSLTSLFFEKGFYFETEDELKQMSVMKRDKNLYETIFFTAPKKDYLGYAIKLGSLKVINHAFNENYYTLDEKKQALSDFAPFILTNQTQIDNSLFKYVDAHSSAQKTYFHLLKHLRDIDSTHAKEHFETFFNVFKEQYLFLEQRIPEYSKDSFFEQVATSFSHLVRENPNLKKEALSLFLELNPNNPYLISIEKKGLDAFFKKMDKREAKRDEQEMKQEVKLVKRQKI